MMKKKRKKKRTKTEKNKESVQDWKKNLSKTITTHKENNQLNASSGMWDQQTMQQVIRQYQH